MYAPSNRTGTIMAAIEDGLVNAAIMFFGILVTLPLTNDQVNGRMLYAPAVAAGLVFFLSYAGRRGIQRVEPPGKVPL